MRQPAPKLSDSFRKNVQEGEGLSGFLKKTDTEILEGVGLAGAGGGWYWENVYRTNVQTAYNAGRALAFDAVKPVALELVGIGDARQTEVCRRLTQPPVRRLYTDEFWKTHWPPFHFGCRTTVRAIYDPAELEDEPLTEVPAGEEPAAGFGTNPLSSGNWWRELKSMAARAKKYGVQGEISRAKDVLVTKSVRATGGQSGGILDKSQDEQNRFASEFYAAIRNRKSKSDINRISENTGISEKDIAAIRSHVFEDEHDLAAGRARFEPDAQIALAWQRLESGEFRDIDILLLHHELEELTLMREKGYDYDTAHLLANEKHPWEYKIKGGYSDEQIQKINAERIKNLL